MKVFVSHHHEDAKELTEVKSHLLGLGIDLFLAHEDIEPGEHDLERIKQEIFQCDAFLLIGNEHSKKSIYCNQEIGMAIAHEKPIISTIHSSVLPWGFLDRQHAIKYREILRDLPDKLCAEIIKIPAWKKIYKKEIQCLEVLEIKEFVVDDYSGNQNLIYLEPDKWNDYSFRTAFAIYHNQIKLGWVKIGFLNQTAKIDTSQMLPKNFPFLKNRFFSFVHCETNLSPEKTQALCFLLNDVRFNTESARVCINEKVLRVSLFRDSPEELKKLQNALRKGHGY